MKRLIFLIPLLLAGLLSAADRPNILWITSEDNAAQWLGCYGNADASTPRMDALAEEGQLFLHAYSNAPVCAVARSTILNGVYAVTQGTQNMRSRHEIPGRFRSYVSYLRDAGYYCTNRSKTDYNFKGNDRAIWDECSGKAHWKRRPEGKPFFAIFNLATTHESSLFPRRNEPPTRLKPSQVGIPPYLPDLPEIRSDFARYHDRMSRLDEQVGRLLDELDEAGVADDTIVFYYSDHGGPTPRGKRYLKDTGVRVPMIVRIPRRWSDGNPFEPGTRVAEPVSFVDLAPTVLSLAGLPVPGHMQGRAFLGAKRREPAEDETEFLFADRFDDLFGMRRGLTDGRWKYIRRFTPNLPGGPYSFYPLQMPAWQGYRKAWVDGKLSGVHRELWEAPQAVEELYDLEADPWEVKDLAADPAHSERLASLRARLKRTMIGARDTGLVPEPMFGRLNGDTPIADFEWKVDDAAELAFLASESDPAKLPRLVAALGSDDPILRYWGLQGLLILGEAAAPAAEALEKALGDEYSVNRVVAAEALCGLGHEARGRQALVEELKRPLSEYSLQYLVNVVPRVGAEAIIPDAWIEDTLRDRSAGEYVKRFAKRLRAERK